MLFLGQHDIKLDGKGRLSIPASYRRQINKEQELFIFPNAEGFLEVGSLENMGTVSEEFMQMAAPFYSKFPKPDQNGRITLARHHRPIIGNETQMLKIFGRGKTFGICSQSRWCELETHYLDRVKGYSLPSKAQINP